MQRKSITADYCSWMIVRFVPKGRTAAANVAVRGDIQGPLEWDTSTRSYTGWFELPAKGETLGFYEVTAGERGNPEILQRVNIRYTFDKYYFSPRWENIDEINAYLADRYAPRVRREILYRYPRFRRDIQLLEISDPAVPVSRKQIVFITARVHNPESGTTASIYRFVQWLLEGPGREFLREYLFLIIPMVIPLTFEEDPRAHAVNREWRDETVEPDILAIREKVLDRYSPEVWIDCHTFNAEMDLANKKEMREQYGDYIVAHPPDEQAFDYDYSRQIARRLIRAGEARGHRHRPRSWFVRWERDFQKRSLVQPGEKVKTDFDPAGIFSGKDYAFYADRDAYGRSGRTWAAMACDYGYARCHAINLCLESKPLHVYWGKGPFHYPRRFSDSTVVKLQELCRLGREHFHGQNYPGFPCNLVLSDIFQSESSVVLCAAGRNREQRRRSRAMLWRQRRSLQLLRDPSPKELGIITVRLVCVGSIRPVSAALRVKVPAGATGAKVTIDGRRRPQICLRNGCLYLPLIVQQGKQEVCITWHGRDCRRVSAPSP